MLPADNYTTRLEAYVARHCARLLEDGLSTADYRLLLGQAESLGRRTGRTVDAVLGGYGVSLGGQAAIDAFVRTVERRSRHRVLWLAHGGLERIRALFAANG